MLRPRHSSANESLTEFPVLLPPCLRQIHLMSTTASINTATGTSGFAVSDIAVSESAYCGRCGLNKAGTAGPQRQQAGRKKWSVMQDSNLRPLGPKPSALPSCANHRLLNWGKINSADMVINGYLMIIALQCDYTSIARYWHTDYSC